MVSKHIRLFVAAGSLVMAGMLLGQTAPSTAPSGGGAATRAMVRVPSELKIALMDGSIVTGKISIPELTIETKFGTLKVPLDQVESFAPGLNNHPEFDQKITSLINDLGSDAFSDRENAQQALTKIGPEIKTELEREAKTAEAERLMRIQKILEDFEALNSDDDAEIPRQWIPDDVISTQGFTIVGRITSKAFSVTNTYGTLKLQLSDIREAHRDNAEVEEIRKSFAVSGNLINSHSYVPSGVHLNRGDVVMISATGTINLSPWGTRGISSPDGAPNTGIMPPNIPFGTLIARLGNGADPFKVGSKFTYTATKAGTLEFGVAMTSDYAGNSFPGEYQVKIKVVRKAQ